MHATGLLRRHGILALALLLPLVGPLAAQAARKDPSKKPIVLAMTEGLLKVCGPVNPAVAAQLLQKSGELSSDLSEEELAAVRSSDEYQAAYQSLTDSLGAQDEQSLKQLCSGTPAADH